MLLVIGFPTTLLGLVLIFIAIGIIIIIIKTKTKKKYEPVEITDEEKKTIEDIFHDLGVDTITSKVPTYKEKPKKAIPVKKTTKAKALTSKSKIIKKKKS